MNAKILKDSNQYNLKINMYMKENGKIINVMGEVFSSGKMALFMRVIGKIMWLMVSAD